MLTQYIVGARMNYRGILGAATLSFGLMGHAVYAQSTGIPAEFPPSSFTANQFVDSGGCAFIRAGVGGAVTWVPRVDRRRNQLCNFQPTFAQAAPAPAPQAAPAPRVVAAAPAPRRNVGAPIQTVASITTAPSLVQIPNANTATARSPQVVRNVAPVPAPAPVPTPAVVAPAPVQTRAALCVGRTGLQPGFVSATTGETINCGGAAPAPVVRAAAVTRPAPLQTRAQLCVGRTGLQPGFVSSTTGETINCGGTAPTPTVRAAAVTRPAPLQTKAQLCVGRTGPQAGFVSASTGQTIDCGGVAPTRTLASAPAPTLRMTMAQVCADIRTTGRNFVNAQTGLPVRCGPQTQALTAFAPARPAGPSTPAIPTATPRSFASASCPSSTLMVDGFEVRCGPQTQPITIRTSTFDAGGQVTRSTVSTSTSNLFGFGPPPVPASNPVGRSQREVLPVPKGYTRVWSDGRHNPNRGLPQATAPALTESVSSRTAPVAVSHRYVQVATFASAANAQALGQRFMGMGLPVGLANASRGKIVMLGPFASANALNRGLSAARSAGFGDAYTRN